MFFKSKFIYFIPTHTNYVYQTSCICMNQVINHMQKLKFSNLSANYNKRSKIGSIAFYSRNYNIHVSTSSLVLHNCNKLSNTISLHIKSIHSTTQCENIFDRTVPRSPEEVLEILNQKPYSSSDSKLLKIAIIGVPNSGKSTLINTLLGWRVCSVSSKVHTTQCSARAVSNHDETQLVYLDTPGIVTPEEIQKYKLKTPLVLDPEKSLEQADLIAVIHDVSNSYTHRRLHPRVLRLLLLFPKIPSILILNKEDRIRKKGVLLDISKNLTDGMIGHKKVNFIREECKSEEELRKSLLNINDVEDSKKENDLKENESNDEFSSDKANAIQDAYDNLDEVTKSSIDDYEKETAEANLSFDDVINKEIKPTEKQVQQLLEGRKGWPRFSEVFMISALEGLGTEDLKDYFIRSAKKAPWIFSDDVVTDQSPQEIVLMTVREKCLENFASNIPYELKFKIVNWQMSESDVLNVVVAAYSLKKKNMKILIGNKGMNAIKTAKAAEQDLRNTFKTEVRLRVNFLHDDKAYHMESEI